MRRILIDAPGAGDWIMSRVAGSFAPERDHCFTTHRGNWVLGGIVVCEYRVGSFVAHMAGDDPHWFSRELAWLACDYAFNQVRCHKLLTFIRSDNIHPLSLVLRGGWRVEATICDVFEPGVDMVILSMTRDACRWLDYQPRYFKPKIMALLPE